MKKILLIGGWAYGNIGDEAIFRGLFNIVVRQYPDSEIIITSYDVNFTEKFHGDIINGKISIIKSLHKNLRTKKLKGLFLAIKYILVALGLMFYKKFVKVIKDKDLRLMLDCDLIIFGGGGYFNDLWSTQFWIKIFEMFISICGKGKVVITGQTVGPFYKKISLCCLKKILPQFDKIMVRDITSFKILKDLGCKNMIMGADSALLLKSNLSDTQSYITITFQQYRDYISKSGTESNESNEDEYKYKAIKLIQALSREVNVKVIPSTFFDYAINKEIYDKAQASNSEFVNVHNINFEKFISTFQGSKLCISTNMHPLIISSQALVPTIAISYWYKMDDYLASINREKYCFRMDRFRLEEILKLSKNIMNGKIEQNVPEDISKIIEFSEQTLIESISFENI